MMILFIFQYKPLKLFTRTSFKIKSNYSVPDAKPEVFAEKRTAELINCFQPFFQPFVNFSILLFFSVVLWCVFFSAHSALKFFTGPNGHYQKLNNNNKISQMQYKLKIISKLHKLIIYALEKVQRRASSSPY